MALTRNAKIALGVAGSAIVVGGLVWRSRKRSSGGNKNPQPHETVLDTPPPSPGNGMDPLEVDPMEVEHCFYEVSEGINLHGQTGVAKNHPEGHALSYWYRADAATGEWPKFGSDNRTPIVSPSQLHSILRAHADGAVGPYPIRLVLDEIPGRNHKHHVELTPVMSQEILNGTAVELTSSQAVENHKHIVWLRCGDPFQEHSEYPFRVGPGSV